MVTGEVVYPCPLCDSEYANVLGTLGKLTWLRCVCCGIEYSILASELETMEE